MLAGSLSRRYARALLAIAIEKKTVERLGQELTSMADSVEGNKELRVALTNPSFSHANRAEVLSQIGTRLSLSPVVRNFLFILLERNRIVGLGSMAREYRRLADEEAGRVRAELRSATPLSEADVTRLRSAIEQATGKKVELQRHVEPELLGGVVMKIGSVVYDGSIRAQLDSMRQRLLEKGQ